MIQAVPEAAVIMINTIHLAIAVKFERNMQAPVVAAKGAGRVAARIRAIAEQNEIPIIEKKSLAHTLYSSLEIGHYIPAELYQAVAEVLVYVYRLKGMAHA